MSSKGESMTKRKWLLAGGGVLVLAACGTSVAQVVRSLSSHESAKSQYVRAATKTLAQGGDAFPVDKLDTKQHLPDQDDPQLRDIANRAELGDRGPDFYANLLTIASEEAQKWGIGQDGNAPAPLLPAWRNLGPGATRVEWNGSYYTADDTGRPTAIKVDPATGFVYVATSGGGVWGTTNFGQQPQWSPLTESLGSLAVGSMDINSSKLFLGMGDAFDQGGGVVITGTTSALADGGFTATWGNPVKLSTNKHPADGQPSASNDVRDIKVDPNNPNIVLAASNDGLYRSTDGAKTFTLIDLPNAAPAREATWSIVFLGPPTAGAGSNWMVSGVWGCQGSAPQRGLGGGCPPLADGGADPNQANFGDIWTSLNNSSGATGWTSLQLTANGFPAWDFAQTLPDGGIQGVDDTGDVGRIALGAGAPQANPHNTVVYAEAENLVEAGSFTTVLMKSPPLGQTTWSLLAATQSTAQQGNLTNPTTAPFIQFGVPADCGDLNLGHGQSWYNLSVSVDPTNSANAIFGGNLCGARTTNSGTSFQLISHWLPSSGQGTTNFGTLPYLHADWHTSIVVSVGGVLLVLIGSDGGLFVSDDVFRATQGELATWTFPDIGLVTDLFYNIGSGDPVFGNPDVVFGGLQDNGTRWRLINDEQLIFSSTVKNWDQIQGGDGIGATVSMDSQGQNATYWVSSEFNRNFCKPRNHDCEKSTRIENGIEIANWTNAPNPFLNTTTDAEPFLIRYAPVGDDAASVVTASTFNAWKISVDSADQFTYTAMSPTGFLNGALQIRGDGISAAPFTYNIGGNPTHIYGVPLTGGNSALITDSNGTFTILQATNPITVGGAVITSTSSVATPSDPTHLGGTDPTKTWLISSVTPSAAPGHVFVTTDGGGTWATFGAAGSSALPNIPVYVIKFDPSDPTDQTIYAATELGLYRTTDGGATWARYGTGLPLVRVTDITVNENGSVVRVSTYGRGVWEVHPHGQPSTAAALGDWDNNKVIDFFDLAPLAGRMGTAANAGAPLSPSIDYDNTLDLTNDSKIDESDLTAQLAKFGSTP
jgi:hypothetical protein